MRIPSLAGVLLLVAACAPAPVDVAVPAEPPSAKPAVQEQPVAQFIEEQTELIRPLERVYHLAWFDASITGTDEAWAKCKAAEDTLDRFLADPERFAQVKALRASPATDNPLLERQLEVLYLGMLGKQVEPALLAKITTISSQVEQAFNTYRGTLEGKQVTQNEIEQVLRDSTDSAKLRAAWEAQKGVGVVVAPKLGELVGLRNEVARKLGFRDYYALRIAENEQDERQLLDLFERLDELTRKPFLEHKAEVDRRLAKRLGIGVDELMPWHYQNPFFQEPPDIFKTGLNDIYEKHDTLGLCQSFYAGIGLEVDDIIERSDLYERKGKSPHAFCADIDREGDIRMLANIVPGLKWQSTMVHELGHAVYDKYIDRSLPWLLRRASHALTTEGVAMMLDRLVNNPYWAAALGAMDAAERDAAVAEARAYLSFASLQFSRWTQVMLRFERAMYGNPDQDLNALWWKLVGEYQSLRRPEGREAPDYASKIHLVVAPVYYHNYMMGELFGAQVHEVIAQLQGREPFLAVYHDDPRVGEFLRTRVFAPGASVRWDELTRRITGKDLAPDAFARRFQSR